MASPNPAPILLLNRRIVERLNETTVPGGSSLEPQWSVALVQRVLGAAAEAILESVANGEEVQFGRLGRFCPKVLEERTFKTNNLGNDKVPEEVTVPRRVKLEFESTSYADTRVKELFALIQKLEATGREPVSARR